MKGAAEKPKLYMNHSDFKNKSIEEVFITQIVSPDKFFVRKVISQKHTRILALGNGSSVLYLPTSHKCYSVRLTATKSRAVC